MWRWHVFIKQSATLDNTIIQYKISNLTSDIIIQTMNDLNQKATYSMGNIMQQNDLFYSYFNCFTYRTVTQDPQLSFRSHCVQLYVMTTLTNWIFEVLNLIRANTAERAVT